MDVLRLFTIPGLLQPDIPKLSVAFLPVKTYNVELEMREDFPAVSDRDDHYTIDGPDDDLDTFA